MEIANSACQGRSWVIPLAGAELRDARVAVNVAGVAAPGASWVMQDNAGALRWWDVIVSRCSTQRQS